VLDNVVAPDEDPAQVAMIVRSARELAERWPSAGAQELHGLVRKVVSRVTITDSAIDLVMSKAALRSMFLGGGTTSAATKQSGRAEDGIHLKVDAVLKRCGVQVRLIVPPNSTSGDTDKPAASLVKALARAKQWYDCIAAGEATSMASIARLTGLSERYVGKVFRCAFLAPDIVEAILDGRHPPGLSFERLCQGAVLSWAEQRSRLGFPGNQ